MRRTIVLAVALMVFAVACSAGGGETVTVFERELSGDVSMTVVNRESTKEDREVVLFDGIHFIAFGGGNEGNTLSENGQVIAEGVREAVEENGASRVVSIVVFSENGCISDATVVLDDDANYNVEGTTYRLYACGDDGSFVTLTF